MKIFYHNRFIKLWNKLPKEIKTKAKVKIAIFQNNIKHPSLHNHKLKGGLDDRWSFSIDKNIRILYEYQKQGIIFLCIGKHDDIYR
jgi:mRNA-degrading endonuclease RelE of RelBE toxin-antitoxin system